MRFFEFKTTLIEASGLINRKAGDEWVNPNDPTDIIKFVGNSYTAYPEDELQFESVEDRDLAVEEITKEYPDITFSNSPTNATLAFAIVLFDTTQPQQQKAFLRFFNNTSVAETPGRWDNKNIPGFIPNFSASRKSTATGMQPSDIFQHHTKSTPLDTNQVISAIDGKLGKEYSVPIANMVKTKQLPTFVAPKEVETAIRDNLGESIGPIAFISDTQGITGAWKDAEFLLGDANYSDCSMFFPSAQNNPLCDSYLVAPNGMDIGISSKGKTGADASASNLFKAIETLKDKDPNNEILTKHKETISIVEDITKLSMYQGPIELAKKYNLITHDQGHTLYEMIREKSPAQDITEYPDMQNIFDAYGFKQDEKNKRLFKLRFGLLANVAKIVSEHINNMPEFQQGGIKLLNQSSIVQVYTNTKASDGKVVVTGMKTVYPPNFKGRIELNGGKNYTGNNATGKIAFTFKK